MTFSSSGVFPPACRFPTGSMEMELLQGETVPAQFADPRRLPRGFTVYTAPALPALRRRRRPPQGVRGASGSVSVSEDEGAQQFAKPLGATSGEFLCFLVTGIAAGEPGREVGDQ